MEVIMGAWSHEPFGNDTACDWAYGLIESEGFTYIESTLNAVLSKGSDYLEADEAEEAIAAIAVIAKILDGDVQSDAYPEEVDKWVKSIDIKPDQELLAKARTVIDLVLSENSELLELWQEGDDAEEWKNHIESLKSILAV